MFKLNIFSKQNILKPIHYIIEDNDWVIKEDGESITRHLREKYNLNANITTNFKDVKNSILHFGSRTTYFPTGYQQIHPSNKVIFTWFHFTNDNKDSEYLLNLKKGSERADFVHTSNQTTKKLLIENGVSEEKIVVIPLGIDIELYKVISKEEKLLKRKQLGIPDNAILIGSFQKDGNGWDEGNEPKLEKGPDIFCDVVEKLSEKYPVFVLLTGPARGYVKNRLSAKGIPFIHKYLEDPREIPQYFNLLDLYIVSSRNEGGPKAIMQSLASGVPLVSTKVGMASDILENGKNALLSDIEDIHSLVKNSVNIIENEELRDNLIKNGLDTSKKYGWDEIVQEYYDKLYKTLI